MCAKKKSWICEEDLMFKLCQEGQHVEFGPSCFKEQMQKERALILLALG